LLIEKKELPSVGIPRQAQAHHLVRGWVPKEFYNGQY
jgi:hypothetical protein